MYAALGVILLVAGAILTFAVSASVEGMNLREVGWILMAGGGLSLLIAAIQGAGWMSRGNTRTRAERHVSADGRHVIEDVHVD